MYASYVGHDTIVNLLLDAGVDPSCSTPYNLSPLMVAAGCGNESVCYFLIQVRIHRIAGGEEAPMLEASDYIALQGKYQITELHFS